MDWIYILGAIFLGWSLGSNDAANAFGSAVGSKIISHRYAIALCAMFVIIGSFIGGSETTKTISSLGGPSEISHAFIITLASAICVSFMSYIGLPVSTTQAIIGAIVGWNIFSNNPINSHSFIKVIMSWIISPILAGLLAIPMYIFFRYVIFRMQIHILYLNEITRWGLIIIGIFASYSLGANNVGNVVGVYTNSFLNLTNSFSDNLSFYILLLLGGLSIALGVISYSKKTMLTVGKKLFPLTPENAFIAVFSHSLVLLLFSSNTLTHILKFLDFPAIPPIPVSSSQAIIGAIIGIGLWRNHKAINYNIIPSLILSWIATPFGAAILCLIFLYLYQIF